MFAGRSPGPLYSRSPLAVGAPAVGRSPGVLRRSFAPSSLGARWWSFPSGPAPRWFLLPPPLGRAGAAVVLVPGRLRRSPWGSAFPWPCGLRRCRGSSLRCVSVAGGGGSGRGPFFCLYGHEWSGLTKYPKCTIMVPQRGHHHTTPEGEKAVEVLRGKNHGKGGGKTMKIRLVGGFHSAPETMLVLGGERWEGESIHDAIARLASERQLSRLNGHFCGVSGCTCGSWCRAEAAEEV